MTTEIQNYSIGKPIEYSNKFSIEKVIISADQVRNIVVQTNTYLSHVNEVFSANSFSFFQTLGQRNLSGFLGEVFSFVFVKNLTQYKKNPHADGRPDLIDLSNETAQKHFKDSCISISKSGEIIPIRGNLAPFKYGGIEVKTTIGNLPSRKKNVDKTQIQVGTSRADMITSLSFWGHHGSCESLLGLYYDYYGDEGIPQIIAAMFAQLDPKVDWRPVSTGKIGSKKTSNTSLSVLGNKKIAQGLITCLKSPQHIRALERCGIRVNSQELQF